MWLGLEDVKALVRGVKTVAVLGAHVDPDRPSHYVPAALFRAGVTIVPVNAALAGQQVFGRTILASLADIDEPVDVLDVFRRSEAVAAHVPEILAMARRPGVVWLQSGIRDDAAGAALVGEGIGFVQDRCLMVNFRAWSGR